MADDSRLTAEMSTLPSAKVWVGEVEVHPSRVFIVTNRWRKEWGTLSEERAAVVFIYGHVPAEHASWQVREVVPVRAQALDGREVTVSGLVHQNERARHDESLREVTVWIQGDGREAIARALSRENRDTPSD